MSKENILVLFGGSGVESDVSIISAIQVMNGFDKNKYFVINGYLNGNGEFLENEKFSDINHFKREIKGNKFVLRKDKDNLYLVYNNPLKLKKKIDYVVPVFHGKGLEDGTIKSVPTILYYNEGKVVDIVERNDDNMMNSGDFQKLLDAEMEAKLRLFKK